MFADLVTPSQVAEHYSIPLRTVQAACNSGAIKASKLGRMWVIEPSDAEAWVERWHRRGSKAPDVNVLYRFYNKAGTLLYVGITAKPPERFRHHLAKQWWAEVANIAVESYDSYEELVAVERMAIQQEHPLYNLVHNTCA
jgi:predicted GIY-YIG superfamily endonuclease